MGGREDFSGPLTAGFEPAPAHAVEVFRHGDLASQEAEPREDARCVDERPGEAKLRANQSGFRCEFRPGGDNGSKQRRGRKN